MALSTIDQSNINKVLKKSSYDTLEYNDFFCKNKFSEADVLEFFTAIVKKEVFGNKLLHVKICENVCLSILIVLSYCQDNLLQLDEELTKDILDITTKYFTLVQEQNSFKNERISNCFKSVIDIINESYPVLDSDNDNLKLKEKIKDLKDNLLAEQRLSSHLNDEITSLKEELLKDEKEIIQYEKIKANYQKLQKKYEKQEKDKNDFLTKNNLSLEEFEEMLKSFVVLKKENDQSARIESIILDTLFQKDASIDDIRQILEKNKIFIDNNAIYSYLQQLKRRVFIDTSSLETDCPLYKIGNPKSCLINNFAINPNQNQKYLDILLVSDFHFATQEEIDFNKIDSLYDYCVKNSIKYIFNLGDFFDLMEENIAIPDFDNFKVIEDFVKKISNSFPKDTGIYHAILGANHDMIAFRYGIDIIDRLCGSRYDFIFLGYEHCFVNIGNNADKIALHHPEQKFILPDCVNKAGIEPENYLYDFYKKYNKNNYLDRDSIKMDFFGHLHKNVIFSSQNICFVPSYFKDQFMNGAIHARFYFDSDKSINAIILKQLLQDKNLIPINEVILQRTLK